MSPRIHIPHSGLARPVLRLLLGGLCTWAPLARAAPTEYTVPGTYSYTVPPNTGTLQVVVKAGAGGAGGWADAHGGDGAPGSVVTATIAVQGGENVAVVVAGGGQGALGSPSFGTGGAGGGASASLPGAGGKGGNQGSVGGSPGGSPGGARRRRRQQRQLVHAECRQVQDHQRQPGGRQAQLGEPPEQGDSGSLWRGRQRLHHRDCRAAAASERCPPYLRLEPGAWCCWAC